jgi:hypothetical protein
MNRRSKHRFTWNMKKSQLVLALGLVASCARAVQAQSPIDANVNGPDYTVSTVAGGGQDCQQQLLDDLIYTGLLDQLASAPGLGRQIPSDLESTIWTETEQAVSQTADDASYSTPESAFDSVAPESADEGWAARSLLLVCALATILRNSYYKVRTA